MRVFWKWNKDRNGICLVNNPNIRLRPFLIHVFRSHLQIKTRNIPVSPLRNPFISPKFQTLTSKICTRSFQSVNKPINLHLLSLRYYNPSLLFPNFLWFLSFQHTVLWLSNLVFFTDFCSRCNYSLLVLSNYHFLSWIV